MNVRTATLLSIAGVLVAGTAAVAVNTQVLSGSDGPADLPTALTLPVATQVYSLPGGSTVSSAVAPIDQTVQSVTVDPTVGAAPLAESATTLMSFRIGDAAVATVDTAGGVLVVTDVVPSPGWTVTKAEGSGTVRLDVVLASETSTVSFGAFLSGGEILTSVSSETTPTTSPTRADDDEHDDDEQGDEHEDDDGHDDERDGDHDRGDDDD